MCAEECQKIFFASGSSHFNKARLHDACRGRCKSHNCPSTFGKRQFFQKRKQKTYYRISLWRIRIPIQKKERGQLILEFRYSHLKFRQRNSISHFKNLNSTICTGVRFVLDREIVVLFFGGCPFVLSRLDVPLKVCVPWRQWRFEQDPLQFPWLRRAGWFDLRCRRLASRWGG